jgi:hypothetical protein
METGEGRKRSRDREENYFFLVVGVERNGGVGLVQKNKAY